jgi:glutamyl-tRNA reductase
MKILLVGMNHRSASVELRERMAVDAPAPLLQKLTRSDEIDEAVLLSTCNRVEVVALTRDPEAARLRLQSFFARDLARDLPEPGKLDQHVYVFDDAEAVRHVLRVASALDSMVVGEPQILGQTKEAYRVAAEAGCCGPILGRLFQYAFTTAKRVRSETRLAERPVSLARVAVDLARQIFDPFADKKALLIGAGEMIEASLTALRDAGLAEVAVANRTPERAAELATRFDATAHGLDEIPSLLARADVVLTSIGANRPILQREDVELALRERAHRPLFLIDLGVPRNADPEINQLENVYLYDIDDLGAVSSENAEERRREAARGEAIVVEQQQRFDGWFAALRVVPTIRHLRSHAESIRCGELQRSLARLSLGPDAEEAVDALTRSIVNKLLHVPMSRLKREAEREEGMAYLEVARVLFGLDGDDTGDRLDPPGDPDPDPDEE